MVVIDPISNDLKIEEPNNLPTNQSAISSDTPNTQPPAQSEIITQAPGQYQYLDKHQSDAAFIASYKKDETLINIYASLIVVANLVLLTYRSSMSSQTSFILNIASIAVGIMLFMRLNFARVAILVLCVINVIMYLISIATVLFLLLVTATKAPTITTFGIVISLALLIPTILSIFVFV